MAQQRLKYKQIWTQLLAKTEAIVRCPPEMQARVIKAVFNLKDIDKENKKKYRLEHKETGDIIHFRLRKKVNLYEL